MKRLLIVLLALSTIPAFSQKNPTEEAQPIVAEGKRLYRSEMASWYGTDLFLEKYKDRNMIGGYFSYEENNIPRCIFFSNDETVKVIGTMTFDSTYNTKTATVDLTERDFSTVEKDYYELRKSALNIIMGDTMFKTYRNMNLNLIPIINGSERKLYILTGTSENGLVIFGNDYLLIFNKNNGLLTKKALHRNIIPVNYGGKDEESKDLGGTMHTHLPETGDFITATDICTLMLYKKLTNWKQHTVVSEKYLNIWDCVNDKLVVLPMDAIKKIYKEDEKQDKKKDKKE